MVTVTWAERSVWSSFFEASSLRATPSPYGHSTMRTCKQAALGCLALLVLAIGMATACDHYMSPTSSTNDDIEAYLGGLGYADVKIICFAPGTYTGFPSYTVVSSSLTIHLNGSSGTVFQGISGDKLLRVSDGVATMSGIEIRGFGGGGQPTLRIDSDCAFSLHNCTVHNVDNTGGFLRVSGDSYATVTDCLVYDVDASHGEAIFIALNGADAYFINVNVHSCSIEIGVVGVDKSVTELTNCTSDSNSLTGGGGGSLVWAEDGSDVTVIGCYVHDQTTHGGGAVRMEDGGTLTVASTIVSGVSTDYDGGAFHLTGGVDAIITDTTITAISTGGSGAVYVSASTVTLDHVLVHSCDGDTGSVVVSQGASTTTLTNCVFVNNAGSATVTSNGTLSLRNTTVSGNSDYGVVCTGGTADISSGSIICDNEFVGVSTPGGWCAVTTDTPLVADCSTRCAIPLTGCVAVFDAMLTTDVCTAGEAPTHCHDCHLCPVNECARGLDDCGANTTCLDKRFGWVCLFDECASGTDNCHINATCTDTEYGFDCSCNPGSVGNGVVCVLGSQVDECTLGIHDCHANASCVDTAVAYNCSCNSGTFGNGLNCTSSLVDECAVGTHNCHANASCVDTTTAFNCSCNSGTAGDGVTCGDVDECGLGTHNCDGDIGMCTNTAGSFTCACGDSGYTLDGNGFTCNDVDECASGGHDCRVPFENCVNTVGSFNCSSVGLTPWNVTVLTPTFTSEGNSSMVVLVAVSARVEPQSDVSLPVSSSDSGEGLVSPTSLAFGSGAGWATAATVTVVGVDDSEVDADVAYFLVFGTAVSDDGVYSGASLPPIALTNLDDEEPSLNVTLDVGSSSGSGGSGVVSEDGAGTSVAAVRVVLTAAPSGTVVVPVASSDTGEGVVLDGLIQVVFGPGNWSTGVVVGVAGVDDEVVDGDVGFQLVLGPSASGESAFAGLTAAVDLVCGDNDTAGVTLTDLTGFTTEDGSVAAIEIKLTSRPAAHVNITVAVSDSTEAALVGGVDSVSIAPSEWATGATLSVFGVDDALLDSTVLYSVVCSTIASSDSDYGSLTPADYSVVIPNVDNDDSSLLQVSPATDAVYEATPNKRSTIFVNLAADPGSAGVVVSAVSADTTEVNVVATSASLSFTSADFGIPKKVLLTGVDDLIDDGDVAVDITLSVAGYPSATRVVGVTSVDNDVAQLLVVSPVSGNTNELGAEAEFSMALATEPIAAVTVRAESLDKGEARVREATRNLVFSRTNWATAQTVTLVGVRDDDNSDGDVTFTVALTATTSAGSSPYNGLTGSVTAVNEGIIFPTIDSVEESELSVLLGWEMEFVGSDFVDGCRAYIGTDEVVNLTRVNSRRLEFVSPRKAKTGYYGYHVVNPDGGTYEVVGSNADSVGIYYTNDCPEPGQFGRGLECEDCPEGAVCPGGYRLWPLPGYWTPREDAGYVIRCDPAESCAGGRNSECSEGYEGKLCGLCSEGFHREGKYCVECSSEQQGLLLIVADGVVYFLYLAAALFAPRKYFMPAVHTLSSLQVLRMVGRLNIKQMPPYLQAPYRALALTTFEGVREEGCLTGSSLFVSAFWSKYSLVLVAVCVVLVCISAAKRVAPEIASWLYPDYRKRVEQFYTYRLRGALVVLGVFMYVNLSTLNVLAVNCFQLPNEKWVLAVEPTVECFVGAHRAVGGMAIAMIVVYTIGFPLGIVCVLKWKRSVLWEHDNYQSYGVLYGDFKPRYYQAYAAWLCIMLSLVMFLNFLVREPAWQLVSCAALLLGYLGFMVWYQPYIWMWKNLVKMLMLIVTLVALLFNYLLQVGDASDTVFTVVGGFLLIGLLGLAAVAVANVTCGAAIERKLEGEERVLAATALEETGVYGNVNLRLSSTFSPSPKADAETRRPFESGRKAVLRSGQRERGRADKQQLGTSATSYSEGGAAEDVGSSELSSSSRQYLDTTNDAVVDRIGAALSQQEFKRLLATATLDLDLDFSDYSSYESGGLLSPTTPHAIVLYPPDSVVGTGMSFDNAAGATAVAADRPAHVVQSNPAHSSSSSSSSPSSSSSYTPPLSSSSSTISSGEGSYESGGDSGSFTKLPRGSGGAATGGVRDGVREVKAPNSGRRSRRGSSVRDQQPQPPAEIVPPTVSKSAPSLAPPTGKSRRARTPPPVLPVPASTSRRRSVDVVRRERDEAVSPSEHGGDGGHVGGGPAHLSARVVGARRTSSELVMEDLSSYSGGSDSDSSSDEPASRRPQRSGSRSRRGSQEPVSAREAALYKLAQWKEFLDETISDGNETGESGSQSGGGMQRFKYTDVGGRV